MKNLVLLASLIAASLGLSSCSTMFGTTSQNSGYRVETRQVKTCKYDIITEEIAIPGGGKSGMTQTVEKKVPRYKTVTKKVRVSCGSCVRFYFTNNGCCGTTSESTRMNSSAQGSVGSSNLGLIPTMKPIAP